MWVTGAVDTTTLKGSRDHLMGGRDDSRSLRRAVWIATDHTNVRRGVTWRRWED